MRVRLTGGLGHAFFATTTWALPEAEQDASGARRRLLFPDGKKILLTSAILTASTCQKCLPERNLPGRTLRRCASGSLLRCSCPEREVTNALRFAQPARPKGTYCLRSGTGNAGKSMRPNGVEVVRGGSENLSEARAFGCYCNLLETKFRVPALRGLTLPVT